MSEPKSKAWGASEVIPGPHHPSVKVERIDARCAFDAVLTVPACRLSRSAQDLEEQPSVLDAAEACFPGGLPPHRAPALSTGDLTVQSGRGRQGSLPSEDVHPSAATPASLLVGLSPEALGPGQGALFSADGAHPLREALERDGWP